MTSLPTLRYFCFALLLGPCALPGRAQSLPAAAPSACLMLPLDAAERAQRATLVVEAEVVSQQSFWDAARRRIYTANTLRVFKLFKGSSGPTLTVLTEGGTVGLERQELTNTLRLQAGAQGLLFLQPARFPALPAAFSGSFTPFASQQGFVRYDIPEAAGSEPFRRYPLIDEVFYREQAALTGQPWRELQPNPGLQAAVARRQMPAAERDINAPVITSLAPAQVTAGTGQVLAIRGAGFGAVRGSVEFANADDGGSSFTKALSNDIISWTDSEIRVRVPSLTAENRAAGTGPVRVVTADQQAAASPVPLTVLYVEINVQETNSQAVVATEHFNQNGSGGYHFQPDPALAQNAAALQAFGRGLASWRCQTAINWELGSTRSARGIANDDVNAVEFDQAGELPERVLGRTINYYLGCREPDGRLVFRVKEFDMQFDDATSWYFGTAGPTPSQYDFESVAVHELGHAHQLGHVVAPAVGTRPPAVMHYAINRGQVNRQLDFDRDVRGGHDVLLRSVAPDGCGPGPMLPAPLAGQLTAQPEGGGVRLRWATRQECNVQAYAVERSQNQQTWTRLGQVAPGAAGGAYSFLDAQAPDGLVYYRLQVQLANGLSLAAAPTGARRTPGPPFSAYPNPRRGAEPVRLEYNAPAAGNLAVRVYDAAGRTCGGAQLAVRQAGIEVLTLRLPALRAGWYVLRWEAGGQRGAAPLVQVE